MNLSEKNFNTWYETVAKDEERALTRKVEELGLAYFDDMRFEPDSIMKDFITVQSYGDSMGTFSGTIDLPRELDYFSYQWFTYHIRELKLSQGQFNPKEQTLTVDPQYVEDEATILHELIHLHEFVINEQTFHYHDAVLWCLYRDLRSKIRELDEKIEKFGHIYNGDLISSIGGAHDILFLLKSFDIDLRKGYPLGKVLGYGGEDMFND